MEDNKTRAIVAGVLVGVAIVGAAIAAVHHCRAQEADDLDIDHIVAKAHQTVQRLGDAVETLRETATRKPAV